MPKGYYDRSKAKPNRGMFKAGAKAPRKLVKLRSIGLRRSNKIRSLITSFCFNCEYDTHSNRIGRCLVCREFKKEC